MSHALKCLIGLIVIVSGVLAFASSLVIWPERFLKSIYQGQHISVSTNRDVEVLCSDQLKTMLDNLELKYESGGHIRILILESEGSVFLSQQWLSTLTSSSISNAYARGDGGLIGHIFLFGYVNPCTDTFINRDGARLPLNFLIAHETAHIAQRREYTTDVFMSFPSWFREGHADWLASQWVGPLPDPPSRSHQGETSEINLRDMNTRIVYDVGEERVWPVRYNLARQYIMSCYVDEDNKFPLPCVN